MQMVQNLGSTNMVIENLDPPKDHSKPAQKQTWFLGYPHVNDNVEQHTGSWLKSNAAPATVTGDKP